VNDRHAVLEAGAEDEMNQNKSEPTVEDDTNKDDEGGANKGNSREGHGDNVGVAIGKG